MVAGSPAKCRGARAGAAYDSAMAYPKRLLQDDEELVLDLQPHWWFFAKQIAAGIPIFVAVVLIFGKLNGDARQVVLLIWAVLAVAFAVWVVIKYLDWRFTHFVLTSERVIFRTGVLAKRGVEIPLGRINNINFSQKIWERIIGAGDLEIESAGRDGQSLFSNVRHPDGVQQEIYRAMEGFDRTRASWGHTPAQPNAGGQPAMPDADSVPNQLERLAKLRDQGVLTEAEFAAKKAELLRRI